MPPKDGWFSADAYEPYVGRWSRKVARLFVDWVEPHPGADWLDLGCGTGALSEVVLAAAVPRSLRGIDPSPVFVRSAHQRLTDPRAGFAVGDGQAIPCRSEGFDYTVSALALNFMPDRERALAEMKRVTRPGGRIAAYVWDYSEGMEMMRLFWRVAAELKPEAAARDEAARFDDVCNPAGLKRLWDGADLRGVLTSALEIDTVFRDFDDYWRPFLGGQGPAPSYVMALSDPDREDLKVQLARRLPTESDGTIRLRARAWAVQGRPG